MQTFASFVVYNMYLHLYLEFHCCRFIGKKTQWPGGGGELPLSTDLKLYNINERNVVETEDWNFA